VRLRDWALAELPGLNVLVNNAGIQRRDPVRSGITRGN
jgi:short-subunit dehydrogenase involved in D-alanine esterification of teichoic acids